MVRLEGVSACYGLSPVLGDINLAVGAGEAVTLLGRNGVGKTTLLRTIMGLHPVSGGSIWFEDKDITRLSAYERARKGIGYVPQGRGIFPHLTVDENLRLGLVRDPNRSGRMANSIPEHVFGFFPVLRQLLPRKGGVLSGGEQQQLAIGRAIVSLPKLLILDEPTEGIQPSVVQEIEAALKQIRDTLKIAVLLVEQYLDFAWAIADRFYVMRRGHVVEQGNPRECEPQTIAHLLTV